jgi:hypothetical protein
MLALIEAVVNGRTVTADVVVDKQGVGLVAVKVYV